MKFPKPTKRSKPKRRPRRQRKGTPAQLAREADKLWSRVVRHFGNCEAQCFDGLHQLEDGCSGPLQAAHGFSRRYRNTRWLPINGFCLCAAHHTYYTHRPLEWDEWLRWNWSQQVYNELRLLALRTTKPDVAAALDKLRAEAAARGIE